MNGIKVPCYDFMVYIVMDKRTIKKVFFIIIPIVIVVILFVYFLSSLQSNVIPADFTAARQSAASISQDIVNITGDTAKKIGSANQAENAGNTSQLESLISDAKASNVIAYQKAFDLSKSVQQMAESLDNVQPKRQQLGYEAVALELSLVSQFISYTESLNDFLNDVARSALNESPINQKNTADALESVNQKVSLIDNLNNNFIDKMAAFDQAN